MQRVEWVTAQYPNHRYVNRWGQPMRFYQAKAVAKEIIRDIQKDYRAKQMMRNAMRRWKYARDYKKYIASGARERGQKYTGYPKNFKYYKFSKK